MEAAMKLANSPGVYIFAFLVVMVVIFQGLTFIRLAKKTSKSVGMTKSEVKSALKVGAINAIGPSLGIMIIAVSLITLLGNPLTLMRIGIIGSAPIESMGAAVGANAFGTELGASNFSEKAFVTVVWVLCLGGAGWLVVTALFTKSFGKLEKKVAGSSKRKGTPVMAIVSTAAMIGIFANLSFGEMVKGLDSTLIVAVSVVTMVVVTLIANSKKGLNWLNEWSLGISILVSLAVGYFTLI
ncbi:protein of unknown function [Mesobacillus persicus]|uniref:Translation elongation factor EF-1alpha n=1 Tax=Mesobacillus persicus TaxID=930146 RepID=A0A1H8D6Y2_9BACI|nr:DUF5058 family protein [Mesobacillus persicus]SEN03061.1 protein of unknown function [Mesobacillus persicus]